MTTHAETIQKPPGPGEAVSEQTTRAGLGHMALQADQQSHPEASPRTDEIGLLDQEFVLALAVLIDAGVRRVQKRRQQGGTAVNLTEERALMDRLLGHADDLELPANTMLRITTAVLDGIRTQSTTTQSSKS